MLDISQLALPGSPVGDLLFQEHQRSFVPSRAWPVAEAMKPRPNSVRGLRSPPALYLRAQHQPQRQHSKRENEARF
jgi:hypothetical protein